MWTYTVWKHLDILGKSWKTGPPEEKETAVGRECPNSRARAPSGASEAAAAPQAKLPFRDPRRGEQGSAQSEKPFLLSSQDHTTQGFNWTHALERLPKRMLSTSKSKIGSEAVRYTGHAKDS